MIHLQVEKKNQFQQWEQVDFTLMTIIVVGTIGMSNAFIYCYFGKVATDSYKRMSDRVFEMTWRKQSVKLQKYFVLMIAYMQRPVYYHGFNVAIMNLHTFINVCN